MHLAIGNATLLLDNSSSQFNFRRKNVELADGDVVVPSLFAFVLPGECCAFALLAFFRFETGIVLRREMRKATKGRGINPYVCDELKGQLTK